MIRNFLLSSVIERSSHTAGAAIIAFERTFVAPDTARCAGCINRIIGRSLLTALLLVIVAVMKELPATLIMKPFNFDTLAVQAHNLAADERLAEAALPALSIVLIGLAPVILLSRLVAMSRPGDCLEVIVLYHISS